MLIAETKKAQIRNLDLTSAVFAGLDGKVIAKDNTGANIPLASYDTVKMAETAIIILIERIEHAPTGATIIRMPTDDEVLARARQGDIYRHIDGKKTKGHGGS